MLKRLRIRRALRNARHLTFEEASELFHGLVMFEIAVDREVLAIIAERAHDTAQTREQMDRFRAYRNALRAGHRVRVGKYPAYVEGRWTGVEDE